MIEDYKRDGYIVVPDIIRGLNGADEFMKTMSAAYQRSLADLRTEARLFGMSGLAMRLFMDAAIVTITRALGVKQLLLQTSPACHVMGFDTNWGGVAAHQDWPALQSGLNTVTIWIPLHDVGLDNYPLEVVKGSHLMGLLPAKAGDHYSEVDTAGMEFTPVPVPAGGALFMSAFLVHRTRTPGKGVRIAISHRHEDASDPWFLANNYPSAQSRVIRREVLAAPSIEEARRCFGG